LKRTLNDISKQFAHLLTLLVYSLTHYYYIVARRLTATTVDVAELDSYLNQSPTYTTHNRIVSLV